MSLKKLNPDHSLLAFESSWQVNVFKTVFDMEIIKQAVVCSTSHSALCVCVRERESVVGGGVLAEPTSEPASGLTLNSQGLCTCHWSLLPQWLQDGKVLPGSTSSYLEGGQLCLFSGFIHDRHRASFPAPLPQRALPRELAGGKVA